MNCCPLSSDGDWGPSFYQLTIATAGKRHCCNECGEAINVGTKHEKVVGKWDGRFDMYRTCPSCVEIRNHFACDGWIFGELWNDLEENFFPDMAAGGPCMEGLSPEAKGRLFELRLKWMEDQ